MAKNNLIPPRWYYFPLREFRAGHTKVSLEAGFTDAGDFTYGVGFWNENGVLVSWAFTGELRIDAIAEYYETVTYALWLQEHNLAH